MKIRSHGPSVGFVTVGVPTHNRASTLGSCLASLAAQDFDPGRFEVLVVDDGSEDATGETVRDWQRREEHIRFRYCWQAHGGLNVVRNRILAEARGDLIILFDDDEESPRGWLAELVAASERHPEAGCVGGPVFRKSPVPPPRTCLHCSLDEGTADLGGRERVVEAVAGGNMAIRRWAVERIGGFDPTLSGWGDELEWQMRLRSAGIIVFFAPGAWAWHRRSAADSTVLSLMRRQFRREFQAAAYAAKIGQPYRATRELGRLPRLLAHSLTSRCWWGIVSSSGMTGRAVGSRLGRRPAPSSESS